MMLLTMRLYCLLEKVGSVLNIVKVGSDDPNVLVKVFVVSGVSFGSLALIGALGLYFPATSPVVISRAERFSRVLIEIIQSRDNS